MKSLDHIYELIVEEAEHPEHALIKDQIIQAGNMIVEAQQRLYIANAAGIDISKLGVTEDRKVGRRKYERRHITE
jgi:hypothetical protein